MDALRDGGGEMSEWQPTPPTADEVAAMREGIELAKQIQAERERERERFRREQQWFQEAANGRQ